MAEALLRVEALDAAYDAVQVVWGLNLQVQAGTVTSLIGSNGAGKTTTMNVIAGTLPARRGEIIFRGEDITTKPPDLRVGMRLSLIPEQRQLWPRMTVEENLLLGAFPRRLRGKAKKNLKNIYEMFPRLGERRKQHAGTLSGGEQQMCAIGRGLMAEPLLLMLDEPSLGLAPMLVEEIFHYVRVIAARGVTILLAAQNANYALQFSDYSYVLESGRIALEGRSEKLRCDDHVRRAYMRSEEHTSELQSQSNLVCRLLLEKKKQKNKNLQQSPPAFALSHYDVINHRHRLTLIRGPLSTTTTMLCVIPCNDPQAVDNLLKER